MSDSQDGYRVAILGASSLPGKEIPNMLRERHFPVASLATLEDGAGPRLPVLNLSGPGPEESLADSPVQSQVKGEELDFLFIASETGWKADLVDSTLKGGGWVILLAANCGIVGKGGVMRIPSLEADSDEGPSTLPGNLIASPHPATLILAPLLTRLERRFSISSLVTEIFESASAQGAEGIEELQHQTMNLLQFQKIPERVFGAQLAFNFLPRLGGEKSPARKMTNGQEVRVELEYFLGCHFRMPVPRIFQVPLFYSVGVSLYVELDDPASLQEVEQAIQGAGVEVRGALDDPPSPVEVAGSDAVLAEVISAGGEAGMDYWIWAVADNVRISARNAVEIAESLIPKREN